MRATEATTSAIQGDSQWIDGAWTRSARRTPTAHREWRPLVEGVHRERGTLDAPGPWPDTLLRQEHLPNEEHALWLPSLQWAHLLPAPRSFSHAHAITRRSLQYSLSMEASSGGARLQNQAFFRHSEHRDVSSYKRSIAAPAAGRRCDAKPPIRWVVPLN